MKRFFGQRASHGFASASLVALLVGGPASSYRDIQAAQIEAEPADSGVARSSVYVQDALVDPDLRSVFPDDATALADKVAIAELACCRFRRHRVRCHDGTGGVSWRDGSLPASSSLRLFG